MASFHLSGGADGALRTREWRDSAVSGLSARAGTAEGRSPSPGVDAAPGQSLGPGASVSLEKRLVDVSRELGRERRRREGCERMLMAAEQRMARLAGAVEAQEAGSRAKIKRLREDVDILEEVVEEKTQELHASEREVERGQRSMQELQAELAKARVSQASAAALLSVLTPAGAAARGRAGKGPAWWTQPARRAPGPSGSCFAPETAP